MAKKYDQSSIVVLEGLECIRKKPGVYLGSLDQNGANHMLNEAIENASDEAKSGNSPSVSVTIHKNRLLATVEDFGRGLPCDKFRDLGIPTIDVIFTKLHAGGKIDNTREDDSSAYKNSSGTNGIGIKIVTALSEYVEIWVKRDKKEHYRKYEKGEPTDKKLKILREDVPKKETGTRISFLVDKKYFPTVSGFEKSFVEQRLRELSYLNPNIEYKLIWEDDEKDEVQIFNSKNGLKDYIEYLTKSKKLLHEPIYFNLKNIEKCDISFAFVYNDGYETNISAYCNDTNNKEFGIHYNAALDSLATCLEEIANKNGLLKDLDLSINKSDCTEGLTLIISTGVPNPLYGSQTKQKLNNEELRKPFGDALYSELTKEFKKNKEIGKIIANKVVETIRARDAAKKVKGLNKKGALNSLLAGKLTDCSSRFAEQNELFICEGNCFSKFTKVVTKNGLKYIYEVKIGDEVLTHKDRYKKVINISSIFKPNKCKILIEKSNCRMEPLPETDLKEFICSDDHKWFSCKRMSDSYDWIEVKKLNVHNFIRRTNSFYKKDFCVMGTIKNIEFFEDLNQDNLLYDIEVEDDHSFVLEGGYIVHNSAAGTTKDARDRKTQAVLPLRGKILNTHDVSLNTALENKEIASIVSALGVKLEKGQCDISDLRYHKIIITTDEDHDGKNIACLITTLFFKFLRPIIEKGYLYLADLPLYRVKINIDKTYYLKDDKALEEFKKKNLGKHIEISRFKGLGEMDVKDFKDLAMSPISRNLKQISIVDAEETSKMFEKLMGSEASFRKDYLMEHLNFDEI